MTRLGQRQQHCSLGAATTTGSEAAHRAPHARGNGDNVPHLRKREYSLRLRGMQAWTQGAAGPRLLTAWPSLTVGASYWALGCEPAVLSPQRSVLISHSCIFVISVFKSFVYFKY